jgi:serine O-acetyltransferase
LIPISFFLYEIFSRLYDIKISGHAVIGAGCYIGHFGGIRIGRCQIGKQCNVNHQVKIGGFSHKDSNKSVMIDDHVWIGAHSKIMNSVSIGKGATISAGTVVASNIQDKVLVAGPASRVLKCNYDNAVLLGFGE